MNLLAKTIELNLPQWLSYGGNRFAAGVFALFASIFRTAASFICLGESTSIPHRRLAKAWLGFAVSTIVLWLLATFLAFLCK